MALACLMASLRSASEERERAISSKAAEEGNASVLVVSDNALEARDYADNVPFLRDMVTMCVCVCDVCVGQLGLYVVSFEAQVEMYVRGCGESYVGCATQQV